MTGPAEPMTTRTSTLLASLVLNAGVSAEDLARVSGVSVDAICSPTFVSYDEGFRLWDAAETLTGDPAVGLRGGARATLDQLGVLMSVFVHAADVRDALDRLSRVLPLAIRPATVELREEAGGASFLYVSPSTKRHGVDAMLAAILAVLRQCTNRRLVPLRVSFQAPRPESLSVYEEFFGARPVWSQTASGLTLGHEDLALPMRGAEPGLAQLLERHASEILRPDQGAHTPFEDRLTAAVGACVADGDASVSAVAKRMGVSTRSLQRRLAESGTSFKATKAVVLCRRADELLSREELSLEIIAERIGFASRTSFERAYRRWTGRSPSARRRGRQE